MTAEEKIEAIKALMEGQFDNEQLCKIGELLPDMLDNIERIIEF